MKSDGGEGIRQQSEFFENAQKVNRTDNFNNRETDTEDILSVQYQLNLKGVESSREIFYI